MSPSALPTNYAAVLFGPKDVQIEERTLFPPQYNQVQIQVVTTGLCGSDLHYYQHGRNGDFKLRAPLVLGHEASGYITAVGPGVSHLVPGQRVAIEAGVMCNTCSYCKKGRYNLCANMRFCSSAKTYPHLDGTLQARMNHPAQVVHPLPDNCTFDQAALAEPLSVLLHASRRAKLEPGQTILVFGVGTIGLLACALAKAFGASKIVAIDINPARLDFARDNGFAQQTFCLPPPDGSKTTEDQLWRAKDTMSSALQQFDQLDGFDLIFECTGAEPCIQMSIHAATAGGKVMLVGMGARNVMLPLSQAALREVDIIGSFRYANTYPNALALLGNGKLQNVEKLITHRFGLDEAAKAFDLMARGKDEDGKMVLKVMVGDS